LSDGRGSRNSQAENTIVAVFAVEMADIYADLVYAVYALGSLPGKGRFPA